MIIVSIYKRGDNTDFSNYSGISLLQTTYKILSNILLSRVTPYAEEIIGKPKCGFDATGQLLIIETAFIKFSKKKWVYNEAVDQLFIDLKKAYDSKRFCVILSFSLVSE